MLRVAKKKGQPKEIFVNVWATPMPTWATSFVIGDSVYTKSTQRVFSQLLYHTVWAPFLLTFPTPLLFVDSSLVNEQGATILLKQSRPYKKTKEGNKFSLLQMKEEMSTMKSNRDQILRINTILLQSWTSKTFTFMIKHDDFTILTQSIFQDAHSLTFLEKSL